MSFLLFTNMFSQNMDASLFVPFLQLKTIRPAWAGFALAFLCACAQTQVTQLADCAYVRNLPGPEDLVVQSSGSGAPRLIVSSQERRLRSPMGEPEMQGAIYRVEIGSGHPGPALPFRIENRDDFPFHPHGLHYQSGVLYVINHVHAERHVIEVFSVGRRELSFTGRLESPLLVRPNDLVSAPGGQLYVTNSRGFSGFMGSVEVFLGLGASNVVHFNGAAWSVAAGGLAMANGIEINAGGTRLYVATSRGEKIVEFDRDPVTGDLLGRAGTIKLGSAVDNLIWEDAVHLLAAAHPRGWAFWRHAGSADVRSPSEVFRVNVLDRSARRIYYDDGQTIDAASTAALYGGRIYLGQVFDPEILSCRAP